MLGCKVKGHEVFLALFPVRALEAVTNARLFAIKFGKLPETAWNDRLAHCAHSLRQANRS